MNPIIKINGKIWEGINISPREFIEITFYSRIRQNDLILDY